MNIEIRRIIHAHLIISAMLLYGCETTPTNGFTAVQPVAIPMFEQRPVVIEVGNVSDNRKSHYEDKELFNFMFIPLLPYGIGRDQDLGPPINLTPKSKVDVNDLTLKYGKNKFKLCAANVGAYDIPLLFASYLKNSGLSSNILFEGEPLKDQQTVFQGDMPNSPQADISIVLELNKYERWELITCYGLTRLFAILTLNVASGAKFGLDYDFTFEAQRGSSNQVLLRRTYVKSTSTSFYPVLGGWRVMSFESSGNYNYDLAGPGIREACQDFLTALDKVLPPASDTAYWKGVERARNTRIAKAKQEGANKPDDSRPGK